MKRSRPRPGFQEASFSLAWLRALQPLRPACSRNATFLWLVVVLAEGHHLVTRVRSNAVAYFPPSPSRTRKRRGRRRT